MVQFDLIRHLRIHHLTHYKQNEYISVHKRFNQISWICYILMLSFNTYIKRYVKNYPESTNQYIITSFKQLFPLINCFGLPIY
jgi:hypothetical protein